MRAVYRNPKELATAVKDLVDEYQDDLITYDKFSQKLTKITEANEERFFKNGEIEGKIAIVLGNERAEFIKNTLKK